MNCIFISPNYPAGHWQYCAALRAAGYNVIGIGDAGYESFPYELRGNLNDYIRVSDLHNYDEIYRACASLIGRWGRAERIECLNPYWNSTVEALRCEFKGCECDVQANYSERTAARFAAPHLPKYAVGLSARKAVAFGEENGYPLLVAAAKDKRLGVHSVENEAALKKLVSVGGKDAYIIAAQYGGEPVSVDGLICDGALVVLTAHLQVEKGIFYSLPVTHELSEMAEQCAAAAVGSGFFHIDAVRLARAVKGLGKKGDIVFNRITDTPAHEYVIDCINGQYGCDIREKWASLCCGEDDGQMQAQCCTAIAVRSFERSYKNAHEKILRRLNIKLLHHARTAEPDREEFGDYVYIFRGEDQAELRRNIKFITEDFN